jgi:DNA-binding PadR family transcriptional regulator
MIALDQPGIKPMLSKTNTVLMGLIAQKPLNPYEIQHILNKKNIRDWFPIAESSVYAGIRSLHEKGYLQGEGQKESNMPEKTVYRLTEDGSAVLQESLEHTLSSLDLDLISFNLGLYFMGLLNKGKVIVLLNSKVTKLDEETYKLKKQMDERELSSIFKAMIKHRIYLLFSEARTIRELLEKMENGSSWNEHLVNY